VGLTIPRIVRHHPTTDCGPVVLGYAIIKIIKVWHHDTTLDEVIGFAKEELVVLRSPDGSVFALSQVDDFDVEVELLKKDPEFKAFLRQLSQEAAKISLESSRQELAL
jgi:hypothetical protein